LQNLGQDSFPKHLNLLPTFKNPIFCKNPISVAKLKVLALVGPIPLLCWQGLRKEAAPGMTPTSGAKGSSQLF
jgi:hypothetical protein